LARGGTVTVSANRLKPAGLQIEPFGGVENVADRLLSAST
jgi:hypothetical protein